MTARTFVTTSVSAPVFEAIHGEPSTGVRRAELMALLLAQGRLPMVFRRRGR